MAGQSKCEVRIFCSFCPIFFKLVVLEPCKLQDEFLDVIYWARQILGVILGVVWGIIPLKGFIGLAL